MIFKEGPPPPSGSARELTVSICGLVHQNENDVKSHLVYDYMYNNDWTRVEI